MKQKTSPIIIEKPKSAEIKVKFIGKYSSPAKLPKTKAASTMLQWLDACDPLSIIAAKTSVALLTDEAKGAAGLGKTAKDSNPKKIHVSGIKPNSIFDGCDLDLEGGPS